MPIPKKQKQTNLTLNELVVGWTDYLIYIIYEEVEQHWKVKCRLCTLWMDGMCCCDYWVDPSHMIL